MKDKTELDVPAIAALRELLVKATPGPWNVSHYSSGGQECELQGVTIECPAFEGVDICEGVCDEWGSPSFANANLIAAMRNALPTLLDAAERCAFLEVVNAEWAELADRANTNKPSHDVVWVVERNYGSGTSSDWRYMKYPGYLDDAWTSDWNEALKCYDRKSADAICVDMPDDYDVRITDHQIVFPSFLEWLRSKSPASDAGQEGVA